MIGAISCAKVIGLVCAAIGRMATRAVKSFAIPRLLMNILWREFPLAPLASQLIQRKSLLQDRASAEQGELSQRPPSDHRCARDISTALPSQTRRLREQWQPAHVWR